MYFAPNYQKHVESLITLFQPRSQVATILIVICITTGSPSLSTRIELRIFMRTGEEDRSQIFIPRGRFSNSGESTSRFFYERSNIRFLRPVLMKKAKRMKG